MIWRKLIEEAKPTHHLTLTKAGKTIEEAGRALTTFMQSLRRGSKGRGRGHVEARRAYPVEYIAVLEEHKDFEENGFHWHILLISLDEDGEIQNIPKGLLDELWTSAVFGKDRQHVRKEMVKKKTGEVYLEKRWTYIKRIRDGERGAGYVTKYLLKEVICERRGTKGVEREIRGIAYGDDGKPLLDESGHIVEERVNVVDEVESHARRIRYSRHFFPESTKEMRRKLFAPESVEGGEQEPEEGKQEGPSEWEVIEIAPPFQTAKEYRILERHTLRSALEEREREGKRFSARFVRMFAHQREQQAARSDGWIPLSIELCERWQWRRVAFEHGGEQVEGLVVDVQRDGRVFIQLPDDEETSGPGEVLVYSLRYGDLPAGVLYQLLGWRPGST
jgi:hypothetical protein